MKPRGTILVIGGNEEKDIPERQSKDFEVQTILEEIIKHAGGTECRIELLTCASNIPEEIGNEYLNIFKKLGAENTGNLFIRSRDMADESGTIKRIENADLLLFTGGDQLQISKILRNTTAHTLINRRYLNDNVVIAGTSAGAMVMADDMITGGKNDSLLKKNNLKMGKGLGLLKQVVIDSHYFKRGRLSRLAEAIAIYPEKLGIGLSEDAGMIIKKGSECEVIGSGVVILLDGSSLDHNRINELKDEKPITLINLKVHFLAPRDKYYINEKMVKAYNSPEFYKT